MVSVPVRLDSGNLRMFPAYRVQHSTVARAHEGRHPLRRPRLARRVRGARDVDDVEVRPAPAALRRREGRRPLQPARAVADRDRATHAPLTTELLRDHRARRGHPRPRHGHERADDGLDHGHVLDAGRLRRARDRHGQADLGRRLGRPERGDRRRRRDGGRARVPAPRLEPRRPALRRAGLRERRRCRRPRARGPRRRPVLAVSTSRAGCTRRAASISADVDTWIEEQRFARGLSARRARVERGATRAALRHPRARRARGPAHRRERAPDRREDDRRGRERADARSRRTPIFAERGILVLPDILTNAGGVTVSYFEWVQDLGRLFWDRREIRHKLADKMHDAFDRVWELSAEQNITLRNAALAGAIREVAGALESRGIYP